MMLKNKIIFSIAITIVILIFLFFINSVSFFDNTLYINFNFNSYNIYGLNWFLFLIVIAIFLTILYTIYALVSNE